MEGHQAELASAGLPLSVCLRLQQLDLLMSAAQWSTRQTNGGFSVSFFWLSSTKGGTGQNKLRNRKRRHKRDRQKSTKPTLLPSATVEHDTHPAPVKQSSGSRTPTPINASQSAHARSPSPPNLLAATVPHTESQQSQGSDSSETSSPVIKAYLSG